MELGMTPESSYKASRQSTSTIHGQESGPFIYTHKWYLITTS